MMTDISDRKIAVIGLGYVGLPVAVAFGKVMPCVGYDISLQRILDLKNHIDPTGEISTDDLKNSSIHFTSELKDIAHCDFFVVCAPTPITEDRLPDLSALKAISQDLGTIIKKGDCVVFESTVYPGATEEVCQPLLEQFSKLTAGRDFKIGYSPERINPGDRSHTIENVTKIVAAQDADTLEIVAALYSKIVKAGIHKASSIKVAEAAKIIENTQRDLNIALMNEMSMICDRLNIDTKEVLDAAATKWNFSRFQPGLVGGHCIGVDPYYLTHKAQELGYQPQVILAGRRINDSMVSHVAERTVKMMKSAGLVLSNSLLTILGVTFKENCSDIRNSKVLELIGELRQHGVGIQISDPFADRNAVKSETSLDLVKLVELPLAQALIVAVPHDEYKKISISNLDKLVQYNGVIIDIKSMFDRDEICKLGYNYWRL